eukprot:14319022-Ditylum_brightwellii.AAC.1
MSFSTRSSRMIIAIPQDDKEGKLDMWFPEVLDEPEIWEKSHKALTPNLIDQKDKDGKNREKM